MYRMEETLSTKAKRYDSGCHIIGRVSNIVGHIKTTKVVWSQNIKSFVFLLFYSVGTGRFISCKFSSPWIYNILFQEKKIQKGNGVGWIESFSHQEYDLWIQTVQSSSPALSIVWFSLPIPWLLIGKIKMTAPVSYMVRIHNINM